MATIIPFPQATNVSYEQPLAHTTLKQVKAVLRGLNLDPLRNEDGSLDDFFEEVEDLYIPEATQRAVRHLGTNYDWSREVWFFNGTGSTTLTLPRREIAYVNVCFLRLLPSQTWYRFSRIRNVDGSEFARNGYTEPPPTAPMSTLPPANSNTPYPVVPLATGIEDADLFLNPRSRTLQIPPRVLAATVATPFFNYDFFRGPMNVEVHYAYGFAPTKYLDGQDLVFDASGNLQPLSPTDTPEVAGGAKVDWSSGMPRALTMAVARLAKAEILKVHGDAISQGLRSTSVDGLSESYGGLDPEAVAKDAFEALKPYRIAMK